MTYTFLQPDTTTIKVCGLLTQEHIDVAVGAGVHAIGFVFVPESPRFIDRSSANRLLSQIPPDVLPVAVLQNYGDLDDFSDWPGWLQLCGKEDEEQISTSPCPVIKALQWSKDDISPWDQSKNVEAILIDGSTGGLGTRIPIDALADEIRTVTKPIIVAGGLTPENVGSVITTLRPAAVDVSSGVEIRRGVKDATLICAFVETALRATT